MADSMAVVTKESNVIKNVYWDFFYFEFRILIHNFFKYLEADFHCYHLDAFLTYVA